MSNMPKLPQRRNLRLKNFDYSQAGYYFVTICTNDMNNIFWNKDRTLSQYGEIVESEFKKLNSLFENLEIHKYVIMANHIHFIMVIKPSPTKTLELSRLIQQFKGSITKQLGFPVWQKSFYDRVIRNEKEYEKIYEYIETNPKKWEVDQYYRDH